MAKKSSPKAGNQKNLFASKLGMIAATVGSAVGLGNVWRFPAEVQAGGGAAFLLIYIGCVLLLGIPVMLSEFALGRQGRSDAVGALIKTGASRPWQFVGVWAVIASYIILCFYMVVAGWTFEYLMQSLSGNLFAGVSEAKQAGMNAVFSHRMQEFIATPVHPLLNTFAMIAINILVLLGGVQKGIERVSNIAMPLLFVILLIFVGVSLTLPGSRQGIEFFLNPDFSKIGTRTILSALGQAFFSLSLGMGILITYAGYYRKDTPLTRTAFTVSLLDLLVAVMMGLIIFPAITSFGLQNESMQGATLVFVTLPEVFVQLPGTQVWAALFFLLITIAALTSTISIAEVSVKFVCDRWHLSRRSAVLIVLLPLLVFSSVCSLSMGPWSDITICGKNIFDFLDNLATNIMLPTGSLLLCIYIGWIAPRRLFADQLTNNGHLRSGMAPVIIFIVRYLAPPLILLVLLSPLF